MSNLSICTGFFQTPNWAESLRRERYTGHAAVYRNDKYSLVVPAAHSVMLSMVHIATDIRAPAESQLSLHKRSGNSLHLLWEMGVSKPLVPDVVQTSEILLAVSKTSYDRLVFRLLYTFHKVRLLTFSSPLISFSPQSVCLSICLHVCLSVRL